MGFTLTQMLLLDRAGRARAARERVLKAHAMRLAITAEAAEFDRYCKDQLDTP